MNGLPLLHRYLGSLLTTLWLMEHWSWMRNSRGVSSNSFPESTIQFLLFTSIYIIYLAIVSSHLHLFTCKIFKRTHTIVHLGYRLLYRNILDLIFLIALGEWYTLWNSSLWILYQSPFSSLFGPNIRPRFLIWNKYP